MEAPKRRRQNVLDHPGEPFLGQVPKFKIKFFEICSRAKKKNEFY